MSRDELNEIEQLDALASELAGAGRLARAASARGERPDPAFAMSLRARLLRDLPMSPASLEDAAERTRTRDEAAAATLPAKDDELETLVVSPDWPLDERRDPSRRPFASVASIDIVPSPTFEADATAGHSAATAHRVVALRPSVRSRVPSFSRPLRWAGLAAAAAIALLVVGNGYFWPERTTATATEATLASLVRGGSTTPLTTGSRLHEGDEIKVAAGGHATAEIGRSYVRLSGGSDLRLDRLEVAHVVVSQLAGRVYHRVVAPAAGGDYRVETASVTWTAHGTAFDIDRHADAAGEEIRGLALEHQISLSGPAIDRGIPQGETATIELGGDGKPTARPIFLSPLDLATLRDPWLLGNGSLDAKLGLPLGELAQVVEPEPTPTAIATPTGAATESPAPTPDVTATSEPTAAQPTATPTTVPTKSPTPKPTVKPTIKPTPTPKPTAPPSVGTLTVQNTSGSQYKFSWSKYTGSGFKFYKVVYTTDGSTPNYLANHGSLFCAISSAATTSCTQSLAPATYTVRVQAISDTAVLSESNVVQFTVQPPASLPPTVDLGALLCTSNGDGTATLKWSVYTGSDPVNYYKLPYEAWSAAADPTYPANGYLDALTDLSVGEWTGAVPAGHWAVRVQAIGYPGGSAYAYAQTGTCELTVP